MSTTAPASPPTRPRRLAIRSPPSSDGSGGLLRTNLVVAAGTALSRVTGLVRVVVFAYVIGQTALADAYKLGNETPNIVYDLLLGGVLSATLVPLFTGVPSERDDEESTPTSCVHACAMVAP